MNVWEIFLSFLKIFRKQHHYKPKPIHLMENHLSWFAAASASQLLLKSPSLQRDIRPHQILVLLAIYSFHHMSLGPFLLHILIQMRWNEYVALLLLLSSTVLRNHWLNFLDFYIFHRSGAFHWSYQIVCMWLILLLLQQDVRDILFF